MSARHLLNLFGDNLHTLPLVVLYLTDGCNSRCVTCDIWRNPRLNMSMELVEHIASDFSALGVRWAVLSGGESMQHPQWSQIARRLRAEGSRILLLTNGLLVKKQIADVIDTVDDLVVSLDGGTRETYQAIRGVDGFDLVLEGIRAARAGGVHVTTRTTIQGANYREIPQIIEAARDAGVNSISFLTVDVSNPYAFGPRFEADTSLPLVATMGPESPIEHGPPANALESADVEDLERILDDVMTRFATEFESGRIAESPEKLRKMVDYFRGVLGKSEFPFVRCNAPHTSIVIEVSGALRPCYFLPIWGRIGKRPLSQAINDSAALELRRAYRSGQRAECERCVCPLYKGPRALWGL